MAEGSSTFGASSTILGLSETESGSGETTIDGVTGFSSDEAVTDCIPRNGDDGGERADISGDSSNVDSASELLALLRRAPSRAIELLPGEVGVSVFGDWVRSNPFASRNRVLLRISIFRWNVNFCETFVRSTCVETSNVPLDPRRRSAGGEVGLSSTAKGNGEPDRLTGLLGLFTLGIRLPYNSRLVLCPPSGGAPNPKLPRGIGTPPFCSNFAIFERRLPTFPLLGEELDVGGGDEPL